MGHSVAKQRIPKDQHVNLSIIREPGYEAYSVHAKDGLLGMALIPNVKTGIMLASSFGKTNTGDVDAIEESDDEDASWQSDGTAITFACRYCKTFKKWVPVKRRDGAICSKEQVYQYASLF